MIAIITWAIAAFGLAWGIADSKLTYPFRVAWADTQKSTFAVWFLWLIECPACLGVWQGLGGYFLGITPFTSWYFAAFFTCASNLILAKYVGMMDE